VAQLGCSVAQIGCSVAQVRVQRGSYGSALACCKAGPSSNLGTGTHGMLTVYIFIDLKKLFTILSLAPYSPVSVHAVMIGNVVIVFPASGTNHSPWLAGKVRRHGWRSWWRSQCWWWK
jgi:hypothetical protein